MAEFDPSRPFERVRTAKEFDPSRPFEKAPEISTLESVARAGAQGLTSGLFDEIQAALRAPFSERTYQQIRDTYREDDKAAHEAHPTASTLAELGGGLTTALIPGVGLAKGATLPQMIKQAAVLGGVTGFGKSEADVTEGDLGNAVLDAGKGALVGGTIAGGVGALGKGASAIASAVGRSKVLDPATQRMLAMGAQKTELKASDQASREATTSTLKAAGIYDRMPNGLPPTAEDMAKRVITKKAETGAALSSMFRELGDEAVDINASLRPRLEAELADILKNAEYTAEDSVRKISDKLLMELDATGGKLSALWELKKKLGTNAGNAWKNPTVASDIKDVYMRSSNTLNEMLDEVTEAFATQANKPRLSELNSLYKELTAGEKMLRNKVAVDEMAPTLGYSFKDLTAGAAVGGMADTVLPGTGFAASNAGALASKVAGGTRGRLMRAEAGEQLHKMRQAIAVQAGAIPRTVDGFKQWLTQHMAFLPPDLQMIGKEILESPPSVSEATIRAVMPSLVGQLAPSPYKSELNGRVSDAQDKIAATHQIKQLNLPPTQRAVRQSALNSRGELTPEIFGSVQDPSTDYADAMLAFDARLKAAGY